jgi:predicted Zn-dependent protease with MMP-like domain
VSDEKIDRKIKDRGISMEKRRDIVWDLITEYVAHGIAKHFAVSDQVIEKRLIRENL